MAMVGASGAGGGLAFGGEGSASSVAGRLLSSLGPAKIGREAPAFVHVVHRRKEEQAVRGSWVVYLMCLLFVAAVVIVPPTWRVGSGAGGAIPPPPPFSEDLITPILDAYVFAKDWLIAGTGGESMCALTQHLADSGRTLYTVALARGARCESSGSGAGKGSGGGGDGSSGDDGRGGGKDVGASARAQTVTAYTPGGMSAHYATHRPDAVLLLLWGSLPHDLGSRFKRMVSELAKMAHRKDIIVVSPLYPGGERGGRGAAERGKTTALIMEAGCKRGRRGGGGEESSDAGDGGGGIGGEGGEDHRELGDVVAWDTFTCG